MILKKKKENYDKYNAPKPLEIGIEPLDLNKFKLIKKIGEGSFSCVYKVKQIDTGEVYAAKINKNEIHNENKDSPEGINFLREVTYLSEISHPFIIKFIGFSPIDFNGCFHPVIITEYRPNKSLEHLLRIDRKNIKIPDFDQIKLMIIFELAQAMEELHEHNICHRDLKPENILINKNFEPVICDLGFARLENAPNVPEIVGTPSFIAPESYFYYNYDKPIDVYAFSMILYEIFEKKYSFEGLNRHQIIYKLRSNKNRPPLSKKTPSRYKKLITECWNDDPSKRPTFEQIVYDFQNDPSFFKDEKEAKFFKEIILKNERDGENNGNCGLPKYDFRPLYKKYLNENEFEYNTTEYYYDTEYSV